MTKLLTIRCKEEPGSLVMLVKGEVDLLTAPRFLADFMRHVDEYAHHKHVVVDLSRVVHFAVRGLDVLEKGQRYLSQQHRGIVLVAPPAGITRRLLDVLNFREQMPVLDTLPEALRLAQEREGPLGGRR